MTIGNIAALVQNNVKRLLAYSSIAHAGYLLVAFAALPANGIPAAMFYTAAYAAMNVGAFAVVSHFANAGERYVKMEDYEGLGRTLTDTGRHADHLPALADWHPHDRRLLRQILRIQRHCTGALIGLLIIGVLNSAIGAYYYLRIIVVMYMREPQEEVPVTPIPVGLGLALVLSLIATIYLGVVPNRVLTYAQTSVSELGYSPAPIASASQPVSTVAADAH